MTPTIRVTSIIISCRASLSDKFSSSVSEFLAEILTRTVFPILVDGRVTPSVTCYGVTRAWRGPSPGAQKPGPRLSQCSAQAGLDTDTRAGWAHTEMRWPLGRERERRGRQQGRSGDKTVAIRVLEEQELRVIQREKLLRAKTWFSSDIIEWFRKCELCFCEKFLRCIT